MPTPRGVPLCWGTGVSSQLLALVDKEGCTVSSLPVAAVVVHISRQSDCPMNVSWNTAGSWLLVQWLTLSTLTICTGLPGGVKTHAIRNPVFPYYLYVFELSPDNAFLLGCDGRNSLYCLDVPALIRGEGNGGLRLMDLKAQNVMTWEICPGDTAGLQVQPRRVVSLYVNLHTRGLAGKLQHIVQNSCLSAAFGTAACRRLLFGHSSVSHLRQAGLL